MGCERQLATQLDKHFLWWRVKPVNRSDSVVSVIPSMHTMASPGFVARRGKAGN